MRGISKYLGWNSATALSLFLASALAQPGMAKDDMKAQALVGCPINVQTRVGNPNTSGQFLSLGSCGSYLVATTPPTAQQPVPEGTEVVRIIGVKEQKAGRKARPAASSFGKVSLVRPRGRLAFDREIRTVAANYKIDPLFLHALVNTESGYKPTARSRVGALGLMQIMPATGAGLGVDTTALLNPAANLDAGARHLKQLQKRYGSNFDLILSAYNAGAGAVERYGNKIPPFAETRAYVVKVMNSYRSSRSGLTGVAR